MKTFLALVLSLLCCALGTHASNFTTTVQQGTTARWDAAIWNPGPVTPTAGNTYQCIAGGNPTRIRNPNSGSSPPDAVIGVKTFPGDSLQLDANTEIRAKGVGNIIDFPGVTGSPGLRMNGGNIDTGDNGIFSATGAILLQANSTITCGDSGGNNTRGWKIGGEVRGTNVNWTILKWFTGGVPAVEITATSSPFMGTWVVGAGKLLASTSNGLGNANVTISPTNSALNPGQFEINYNITSLGTLILMNGGQMILHQDCTFSNVTVNGTSLSVGTHPYSELVASFPANFTGGSGSITVRPFIGAPPAPSNVKALSGDTLVRLQWAPVSSANSYWVLSGSTSGGPYTPVENVTSAGYTNTGLVNGSTIYYVVQSTNVNGASTNSLQVVGTPGPTVTGLTATITPGQVSLSWTAPLSPADSYNVKRATTSGGPYTTIATVPDLTYADSGLPNATQYYYLVDANLTGGGVSNPSDELPAATPPSAPVLTVGLWGVNSANLTWTVSEALITQFLIERDDHSGGGFVQIDAVSASIRNYKAVNLAFDTTNTFRIRAANAGGASLPSNTGEYITPVNGVSVNFASGVGASSTPAAPLVPGYLQDTGAVYQAQMGGYSYGWDKNLIPDGRWRQAANSPDIRYDTFVHLIKATPPGVWKISPIPPGFYAVHIVAGDPGNTDSVFQFTVNGVTTDTVVPNGANAFSNFWADLKVSCTVGDDQTLIVMSGPNSQTTANNNKIDFIDIARDIPKPIIIGTYPQGGTIEEGRRFTFSVILTQGSTPISYQWYKDGSTIQDATNSTYKINYAISDRDTGDYWVEMTNPAGTASSADQLAHLDVFPDVTVPNIVSASSLDGTYIKVQWNEVMDIPSAGDASLYHVSGASVVSAQVLPDALGDSNIVMLTISGLATSTFDIGTPGGVSDVFGNVRSDDPIATGQPVFALASGLANDVVVGSSTDPLEKGSTTVLAPNRLEVVAGGSDIWNAADGFRYVYGTFTGDFDMKVRVTRLDQRNRWSKAGIVVREDLAAGGRNLNAVLTPAGSAALDGSGVPVNDFEAGYRPTVGAATIDWGNWVGSRPTNAPPNTNAWLRMRRQGSIFTSYYSTNGADWGVMGTTNQTFTSSVLLGLGTTAHNNGAGQTTTAVYEDLGFIPHPPPSITMQPDSTQTVNQGGTANFSVTATGEAPLSYQWKKNNVNINGANSATYTINNVQPSDAADYIVVITNPNGTATSGNAHLDVRVPPSITGDPQSETVVCGGSVTFTVTAGGSPTLNYQWRKGGMNIENANDSFYHIPVVQQSDVGSYDVVVSNDIGSETSDPAVLTIKPLISCPANIVTTCTGPNGATVNFTVTATDNCTPGPTVQCTPASGSAFAKGTTPVNCTATDKNGNTANCSFTVTVQDNTQVNLSIVVNGSTVTITWPQTCTTYQLQKKLLLDNNPNTWASAGSGQLNGSNYEVTVQLDSNSPRTTFYRLKSNP